MRAIVIALVVGGCYSPTPPAGAPCGDGEACPAGQTCIAGFCGGGSTADSEIMTGDTLAADAAGPCTAWNAQHFDACALPAPLGDLNLTNALSGFSFDTSSGGLKGKMNTTINVTAMVMTQTDGPDVMVMSVNNFTLEAGATLDINGTRPLVIAVAGTATIAGDIDVDAFLTTPGPGGYIGITDPYCAAAAVGDSGSAGTPAEGGGGGGMGGDGGNGGNIGNGPGLAIAIPASVRGGCSGGLGGAGTGATQGSRGAGGGAIQITASTAITVTADASIGAGGGGGGGGRLAYGGGGGGGAGGFIGLDAPTVTVAGVLAANGGGGGGGASDVTIGSAGSTGNTSATAALGGLGGSPSNVGACPRGGSGAAGGTLTGAVGNSSACGGGGGGGGAGYILIWSTGTTVTGTVSPPALAGP